MWKHDSKCPFLWLINYETAEEFHTGPDLPLNVKFCRLKCLDLCKRGLEEKKKKADYFSSTSSPGSHCCTSHLFMTVYNASGKTWHWFVVLTFDG